MQIRSEGGVLRRRKLRRTAHKPPESRADASSDPSRMQCDLRAGQRGQHPEGSQHRKASPLRKRLLFLRQRRSAGRKRQSGGPRQRGFSETV